MKLEDALKKSDFLTAQRVENNYKVIIVKLGSIENGVLQGEFKLRRINLPIGKNAQKTGTDDILEYSFPHIGALLNYAIKEKFIEVKRYATDWEPRCYATNELVNEIRRIYAYAAQVEEEGGDYDQDADLSAAYQKYYYLT